MRLIPIAIVAASAAAVAGATPPPPEVVPPPTINASPPPTVETRPSPPLPMPPRDGKARPAIPYGSPSEWVTNDDYPTRAMREDRQGVTGFQLTIAPHGRPVACDITASSGSPDLDSTTCSLMMRRGRFYPALDADGNPTTGTWSSRFRWVIPEDNLLPAHPRPGQSVIAFTVDEFGYPRDCRLVSGPDPATFMPFTMPCDADVHFPVYKDAKGNPVARQVRMVVGVSLPGAQPAVTRKKRKP